MRRRGVLSALDRIDREGSHDVPFLVTMLSRRSSGRPRRANVDGVLGAAGAIVEERLAAGFFKAGNFTDGEYLVRVLIDPADDPPVVLTAYRTSRIAKYWRTK